ncbi:GNAT family N-acetyltransferase [Lutibacter sp. A64]|uniref:GNAT family N-acetyltransferase n=1 Tax=Lutibacter sp. A64 TaxID=2918526 RepID=UPI001F06E23B|nr:GNAT family N-acetyltransferase [Lutibacter sp. A64]UMB52917.1 GNAT family N-acetyltransferase [Lutibacter sp. A64]
MRKATDIDKQLVSEILVSAFSPLKEKNSINLVLKQDKKRIERMQLLMEYLFERSIRFGEIYISDNNKACILLKFPHQEKTTFSTLLLDVKLIFKCIGFKRVFKVLKRQLIAARYYPKEKHIRPVIMGIKKEYDGSGTAARLMLEVKKHLKNNQLPVIIDAASEKNVKMYQKFGFKIQKKEDVLGFPMYFLRLN